jgi:hypothetical protein
MVEIFRQDDGGGIDRTGQRPAARFVASGFTPPVLQAGLQVEFS